MLRSIVAVIAGFAAWSVAWLGLNASLRAAQLLPLAQDVPVTAHAALAALLASSVLASLVAGAVVAAIAPVHPSRWAMILGLLLLLVGVAVQWQYRDLMPSWYHAAFLVLLVPGCLAGARLVRRASLRGAPGMT
jgi:hypothetical protein